jgi:hypothetical protein
MVADWFDRPRPPSMRAYGLVSYETLHERDGLKYEIVDTGKVGLFGEPIIQACTFGEELVPHMVRRTLGTFSSREDAEACLQAAFHGECNVSR